MQRQMQALEIVQSYWKRGLTVHKAKNKRQKILGLGIAFPDSCPVGLGVDIDIEHFQTAAGVGLYALYSVLSFGGLS